MLIQHRQDGRLRLFRQHDHALASGALAGAWRGLDREPAPLPFQLVLAVALHDVSWRELDVCPVLDEETGRPVAFHEHPLSEKLRAYARGLDAVEAIHPYAALVGSLHYAAFVERDRAEPGPRVEGARRAAADFLDEEEARRSRLVASLELGLEEQARLGRHLRWLQMFDGISIFLCLTPPAVDEAANPEWVDGSRHPETPGGARFHLTWRDEDVLHVDPFPFGDALELRLPYRELSSARFADAESLREAWEGAADRTWWLTLRSAPRLA